MAALTGGPHTIVLNGDGSYEEGPMATTGQAGMNVVMTAASEQLMRDSYAIGVSLSTANHLKLLREDQLQGKTIDTTLYQVGDNAFVYVAVPGDVVLLLVKSGATVNKADGLSADATGAFVVDNTAPKAQALEASGGALAVATHLRARVL